MQDDFAEVIDCPLHQALAVSEISPIGEVTPGDIVPVEFTDCTLNDGRVGAEAGSAIIAHTEFLAANGSTAGHFVMRPGPGEEPDATYSFKWVTAYPSWAAVGHDFELFFNGGGEQAMAESAGRVFTCNHARIYDSRNVRMAAEPQ